MTIEKLAVIGGGAWGTALAQAAAQGGRETLLWALEDDVVTAVNRIHENPLYLKGIKLDPAVRAALETSIERARTVHADQRRTDVVTQVVSGGVVTERFVPVRRVGLYAPGGLAVYPSSVIMNVVPAQIAGVESLVIASPPQSDPDGPFHGLPHPTILAAAELLGVDEVWAVGGAQAAQAGPQAAGLRGPGGGGEFVVALAAGGGARGLRGVGGRGGEVGWWWGCFAGEDGRGGVSVDGGFGAGLVAVWWVGPGVLD